MIELGVLLGELQAAHRESWDSYGDMLKDARVPARARENLLRARAARVAGLAQPKAAFGPFRQMVDGAICLADQTAIVGTTEASLYPVAQYAGISGNQLRAGQVWQLTAFGVITTASSSQGNITIAPRYGLTSSGIALGSSTATALAASGTNVPWQLEVIFIVRSIGNAGLNSAMVASGLFATNPAAIAAATGPAIAFGSTASVSFDASVAAGFYTGVTLGSATDSMKTLGVYLESIN